MPLIAIDRLQPGMFISLESLSWLEHPFLLNRFRITDATQIAALRRMGLGTIEWDPTKSISQPRPEAQRADEEEDFSAGALDALLHSKRDRVQQVREKRENIARCARLFESETRGIRDILGNLESRPNEAFSSSKVMVDRLVGGLIKTDSVAVHLVNLKKSESGLPNHAMNVMVISLLIGKTIGLSEDEMKYTGLGAMLHDAGLADVPSRVVRNPARTSSEEQFYRGHTGFGIKRVAGLRDLPTPAKNIIACHHECFDGSGYPNALVGTKIPKLARLVAIANRYDNLCNPLEPEKARTPAEAVAHMFQKESAAWDPDMLKAFVKAMGVYPPGTFVVLRDGTYGLVIETNSRSLLQPLLMLYDASVPRNEALLLDIGEGNEKIESAMAPQKIPREVIEYLAPQGRVDFYLDV